MPYKKVVDLTACRRMLAAWMEIRNRITSGGAAGLMVCLRNEDGTEEIVLSGLYDASPDAALSASMKMSWEATKRSGVLPP